MFGSTLNTIFLGITAALTIFHYFSLRKEFPYRRNTALTAILPLVLTMAMYMILLKVAPISPLFIYLLLFGIVLGLFLGLLTKVYVKGRGLYGKRSRFYLLLWSISVIFTQSTLKLLGTAAAGIGTTLMFFPLGMALSQQAVFSVKAGNARRRTAIAVLGVLFFFAILFLPGDIWAETNPFKVEKDAAHAYYLLAKDAYAIGDYATAIHYGNLVVKSTRSPGTQAKGYMVIYLAGGGENYGTLAHQGILNSGQLKGISGEEREYAAVLIGLGIMEDIENWQYQGYAIPPEENIISMEGVFAISSSQLQARWEELKISAGTKIPVLGGIMGALDGFVREVAQSSPVSEKTASTTAAVTSAIMILSGLLNIFTNKAVEIPAGVEQSSTGYAPAEEMPYEPYEPEGFAPEEPVAGEPEGFEPGEPEEAEEYEPEEPEEPEDLAEPEEAEEPEEPEELEEPEEMEEEEMEEADESDKPGEPEKEPEDLAEPEKPEELGKEEEPGEPDESGGEDKLSEEKDWLEQIADFLEERSEGAEWLKDLYTNFIDFAEHAIIARINEQRQAIFEALNMKDPLEHAYWTSRGVDVSRVQFHDKIKTFNKGLWYFDVFIDALKNVGQGDSYLDGLLKSAGSNYLTWAVGETSAGPTVALYEVANWLLFGGTEIKDIVSHVNTLKEGSNMLYDKIKDTIYGTDEATKRLESGHYGRNLQNLHHATEILAEWSYNEGQMAEDLSAVVTDDGFYEGMRETNRELWKPKEDAWAVKRGVLWLGEKAFEGWINIAEATKDTAQYLGEKSIRWF